MYIEHSKTGQVCPVFLGCLVPAEIDYQKPDYFQQASSKKTDNTKFTQNTVYSIHPKAGPFRLSNGRFRPVLTMR
jgi:hypothetical protein